MTKDDLKEYVNKGLNASKDALNKAGKAVSKFGDESILKLEISQLKSQIKKDKAALGDLAYDAFITEEKSSLEASDEKVAALMESIKKAQKEIEGKEEQLKQPSSL